MRHSIDVAGFTGGRLMVSVVLTVVRAEVAEGLAGPLEMDQVEVAR